MIARVEVFDRSGSWRRGNQSIVRTRTSTALHVTEAGDPQVEAQMLGMLGEIASERFGIVLRALGHYRDRVALASQISVAKLRCYCGWMSFGLGNDDRFGAACDACHEGEITAIAPHDLHEERTLMRGGRHPEAVDRLERRVQRRRRADCDIGAEEIIVDRGGDADHRGSLARQA